MLSLVKKWFVFSLAAVNIFSGATSCKSSGLKAFVKSCQECFDLKGKKIIKCLEVKLGPDGEVSKKDEKVVEEYAEKADYVIRSKPNDNVLYILFISTCGSNLCHDDSKVYMSSSYDFDFAVYEGKLRSKSIKAIYYKKGVAPDRTPSGGTGRDMLSSSGFVPSDLLTSEPIMPGRTYPPMFGGEPMFSTLHGPIPSMEPIMPTTNGPYGSYGMNPGINSTFGPGSSGLGTSVD